MQLKSINSVFIYALIIGLFTLNSCKEETETPNTTGTPTGNAQVEFLHTWAMSGAVFNMNTTIMHPMTKDTLNFSMLKYYVSNIKFKKSDGTIWSENESYHLIDATLPGSCLLNIKDIPAGTYTDMYYTMGVDSIRNVSGAQSGDLSTANGMFWNWNSGYIMIKAEGTSPNSATGDFALHLGGFKGTYNIVTQKNFSFGSTALSVNSGSIPKIQLTANPARFWHTNPGVSTINKIHMPGAEAKQAATDFYNSIVFTKLIQ